MSPLHRVIRSLNRLSSSRDRSNRPSAIRSRPRVLEALEDRQLLSTFTVTSLKNGGGGSLRAAIVAANSNPGADTIDFGVAGTIKMSKALPKITDTVLIDGTTAPGYAGTPAVTVNFRNTKGLQFNQGSDGSTLRGLSLVRASNAGVTLNASRITVQGNYIGLQANGKVAGNRGDGIRINASSTGNLIGQADPVTSITYYTAGGVPTQPVSGWQGIRNGEVAGQYILTGTSNANGLLYIGPISGVGGTSYLVNYPGATSTSVYGPDSLGNGVMRLVGSYKTGDDKVYGFAFQGTTADLGNPANYETIDFPDSKIDYVHSTMGGLAVGNADGPEGTPTVATGHAFLYDLNTHHFRPGLAYPGSVSTSAYGIWWNGGTGYTIVGGYSTIESGNTGGHGFIVDYDSATNLFTHWTTLDYPNGTPGRDFITHFEGISGYEKGVYNLAATSLLTGSSSTTIGSLVTVRRNTDGSFGPNTWVDINYPGATGTTFADSVAGNAVVGIVVQSSGVFSYQLTVNVGPTLSNVISGNGGNGVNVNGSSGNVISMNNIGTDASGTRKRGNAKSGILLTQGASRNLIGGQATNGNNPTKGVFVRPPQGNLISGNKQNGVLINKGATQNTLSGNFIGTTVSGNAKLGNAQDGVAIVGANGNQLIGCTYQQDPFVFYNVISGNGGNGLRIKSSNDTTVHANFLGVGADNATVVGNHGNGLLVEGTSANTQVGGVIPLGNVISGNDQNGIEVKDKASGFTTFNTFGGLFAFGGPAPNKKNGMLITSTGGNNLIRTNVFSGNRGNGIEIGGYATGVQVTDTTTGTTTDIGAAMPNGKSGILISGHAHGNAVGGFQPSVEVRVTSSANGRYGIEVTGKAHDNVIFNSRIGTDFFGTQNLGNALGGIYLAPGTWSTTVGGMSTVLQNLIRFNGGNGVTIKSSRNAAVVNNNIANNQAYGIRASGNNSGSILMGNVIVANGQGNVDLGGSSGITLIP